MIDGASNSTATLGVGSFPQTVAVNPVTNTIYVANANSAGVNVIDGSTNTLTTTVPVGIAPLNLAVNPVTNMIYVANNGDDTITIIDAATNTPSTIDLPAGSQPFAVAVDSTANKIYVANSGTNDVAVIDGVTEVHDTRQLHHLRDRHLRSYVAHHHRHPYGAVDHLKQKDPGPHPNTVRGLFL